MAEFIISNEIPLTVTQVTWTVNVMKTSQTEKRKVILYRFLNNGTNKIPWKKSLPTKDDRHVNQTHIHLQSNSNTIGKKLSLVAYQMSLHLGPFHVKQVFASVKFKGSASIVSSIHRNAHHASENREGENCTNSMKTTFSWNGEAYFRPPEGWERRSWKNVFHTIPEMWNVNMEFHILGKII